MGPLDLTAGMDDPSAYVDEDVLRRIAVAEGTVDSPYSDVETLVAKVTSLYPLLVGVARERSRTDYGVVARECGVHAARQRRVLHVLGLHEDQLDRPLLPALVTGADEEMPGDDYFRLVEAAPGRPDDVPTDTAVRQWIWGTHRAEVYREWAGTTGSSPAVRRRAGSGRLGRPSSPDRQ